MGARQEAVVNVACIQMEPVVGDKPRNIARSLDLINEAAARGARLIVLPELCNSGYISAPGARSPSATACTSSPGSASTTPIGSTTAPY